MDTTSEHDRYHGKSVRRNALFKHGKRNWDSNKSIGAGNSCVIERTHSVEDSFGKIYKLYQVTEIDRMFSIDCLAKSFSIGRGNIKDTFIEQLEKLAVKSEYDYACGRSCWYASYTVPVCGHMQISDDTNLPQSIKTRDSTFVYCVTPTGLETSIVKKICPRVAPELKFDDDTIGHLKFTMHHTRKNRKDSDLRMQMYTRKAEHKSYPYHVPNDMNDIVIKLRNGNTVTHFEIIGNGLNITHKDGYAYVMGSSVIDDTPYVKSCDLYYKSKKSGKWNLLDRFKCNVNPYESVLIDIRPYHSSTQVKDATQFRIRPVEWNVGPIFRLAAYGQSIFKTAPVDSSETVDYTIYFPGKMTDFSLFPVSCGRKCMACSDNPKLHSRALKKRLIAEMI